MSMAQPIVIGGGPAGSAVAIHLIGAGARPVVYERQPVPGDALCGGFISWKTLERVEKLGIPRAMLGGHAISRLRLVAGKDARSLALPRPAAGVSRRRLDGLLLDHARKLGAEVRQAAVRFEEGRFRLADGGRLPGDSFFLATGKYDLRGLGGRRRARSAQDPFLGLRVRLAPTPALAEALAGHIELHLFHGGYAGLVLHEDGSANLCMAVRKSLLAAAEGDPARLIGRLGKNHPVLAERLSALPEGAAIDAIGHVPYGWRETHGREGLFRLGDQAGVIPSLAGEGIGIALASAEMAVWHWRDHGAGGAHAFQRKLAARLRTPIAVAGFISSLGTDDGTAPWLTRLASLPGAARLVALATRV